MLNRRMRFLALSLAMSLVIVGLAGCGSLKKEPIETESETQSETESETETETETETEVLKNATFTSQDKSIRITLPDTTWKVTQDVDEIVKIVKNIAPTLGGINLEDISAPRCFEIEEKLQAAVDIPVFHDDQHGTAVVVSAAVINSAKLTGRKLSEMKAVINGAGAAGTAIAKMLMNLGISDIVACDSKGILHQGRDDLNEAKKRLSAVTNKEGITGTLADAVRGRDLFIGVSAAGVLTQDMVKTMNKDAVIFAMANPEPEILPDLAKEAGAAVVGTGRSDYPNQINNVLIFPGLFKGALAARAKRITEEMKTAAAFALAGIIKDDELAADYIIPSAFYPGAADIVADAVEKAWKE